MVKTLILDGYNFSGVVKAGSQSLPVVYRPMLSTERREFVKFARNKTWSESGKLPVMARWLERHLIHYDGSGSRLSIEDLYLTEGSLFKALMHTLIGVAPAGDDWTPNWEHDTAENLKRGVSLLIESPGLAKRSCDDCRKFWYDDESATPMRNFSPEGSQGLPILRPEEAPVGCETHDGCPVGHYRKPEGRLSTRNKLAYNHFRLCEATGNFPDDPIVARNAVFIRHALESAGRLGNNARQRPNDRPDGRRGGRPVAQDAFAAGNTAASSGNPFWFAGSPHW